MLRFQFSLTSRLSLRRGQQDCARGRSRPVAHSRTRRVETGTQPLGRSSAGISTCRPCGKSETSRCCPPYECQTPCPHSLHREFLPQSHGRRHPARRGRRRGRRAVSTTSGRARRTPGWSWCSRYESESRAPWMAHYTKEEEEDGEVTVEFTINC